ncbi:hypothetical protein SAMN02745221_01416 [Thermosyntropha lipolytica DSM 11003]|uniref:Uncharacterized protein n=1 Tax=Thermosyntropha lipolytica DSM 11003 TaxID=1123382 RepID=A0A1M5P9Z4_9FIRM|nr:hypothetical protein [Thermosyntropha lipolytica]SHG98644.1 hypothetical protein SAMN02745221_01416 [Thermosyntropha lipolytica DSM 11003]
MAVHKLADIFNDIALDYSFFDPNYAWRDVEAGSQMEDLRTAQNEKTEDKSYWQNVFRFMEAALSNGIIWEIEPEEISANNAREAEYYQAALQSLNDELEKTEHILALFDNWAGTPVDILSPYGDISWGENIFASAEDDLTLEIPVKVYRKDTDYVIKANMPWIKIGEFTDMPLDPKINLKSVLAALPLRINSREAKISFVNGELKVEVPEAAEK